MDTLDGDLGNSLNKIEHVHKKDIEKNKNKRDNFGRLIGLSFCFETEFSLKSGSSITSSKAKCHEVFIGGSHLEQGYSTPLRNKPCESLRCTVCDFSVSSFDNFQWNQSVDYFFLRNNMPNPNKVKDKFNKKPGCRAYACQCTWINSLTLELLKKAHPNVKWVCGKH